MNKSNSKSFWKSSSSFCCGWCVCFRPCCCAFDWRFFTVNFTDGFLRVTGLATALDEGFLCLQKSQRQQKRNPTERLRFYQPILFFLSRRCSLTQRAHSDRHRGWSHKLIQLCTSKMGLMNVLNQQMKGNWFSGCHCGLLMPSHPLCRLASLSGASFKKSDTHLSNLTNVNPG